jgi:hypothetical protein
MPRVIYTRGQLFLRRIWPRGQQNTQPSGRVSTVTGTVDTQRFAEFYVVAGNEPPQQRKKESNKEKDSKSVKICGLLLQGNFGIVDVRIRKIIFHNNL